jgi:excinuclease ABC subunit C
MFDAAALPDPALRAHVQAHCENRPGVYRMYGPGKEFLYVGKSVRVRTRLLSYFRAPKGEKPGELIRETARIEWDYIPDEFGALVREMRLIQEHRPRYNVQHKRRRSYAFVKITREPAPRVLPVTRVVADGATYYGPFPRVGHVARTIRDLAHILGIRDCAGATPMHFADQTDLFGTMAAFERAPGCIRAELGSCPAPCAGGTHEADYLARVERARAFVEGRSDEPLEILRGEMMRAARRTDFEYAAIQRDRMERLQRFRDELEVYRGEVAGLRFVYPVQGESGEAGPRRLYLIRGGLVAGWTPEPATPAETVRLRRRLGEVYGSPDPGPAGLTPHQAAEILLVSRWFRLNPGERAKAVAPERWLAAGLRGRPALPRPSSRPSRTPSSSPAAPRAEGCSPAPSRRARSAP